MKKLNLNFVKRISIAQIIIVVVAIIVAFPIFYTIRNFVTCWSISELPGMAPSICGTETGLGQPKISFDEEGNPIVVEGAPLPEIVAPEVELPSWDGGSRVTILFIGLDARDWEVGQGAPRSDTMILFTIDPISKTAGMLSIPRDLWVNIPGFGYSRINTAYSSGEGNRLPGGGPGLAVKTVEQFIGVPIQFYVQIDFNAFEEAIDAMGGLYLCPGERITIDPIGPKPPVKMGPHCKKYWGYQILGYARNRKTAGGDVDRANRQQKIILALLDQVFSPQNFPTMVSKAPEIYAEAEAGLRTNLGFDDALKLGVLLSQVPKENIKRGVIDFSMVGLESVILNGVPASIFKAKPDKIRVLRDEIFLASGPVSPMASGDLVALMQEDGARVRVVNGTYIDGLPERTGNFLLSQGVQVVEAGGFANSQYARTTLVVYGPTLYTLQYLISVFGVNATNQILFSPDPASPVEIEVRVGADALSIIP
ncbi:MAG: LCP family protein [Anaerolineae bacterium]|nr:LCP family protein [Anaerolineae bacterium]MDK1117718.1 LCP family protein [Anaerolineae bacterium]